MFVPLEASGGDFLLLVRRTLSSGAEISVLLRSIVLFVRILITFCRFKVRYFHTFRVFIPLHEDTNPSRFGLDGKKFD
jgi:hypothetical protein